ncbi:MAG: hypothetical protein Q9M91_08070 [Candidatus Dojkabacteria bacterium]|nr:hypothetical protein [Candidatus Dojkabacteria bacterium]MDQ7021736.1 hypothetical protein [Candidatus Dojkabacteria bacterium]
MIGSKTDKYRFLLLVYIPNFIIENDDIWDSILGKQRLVSKNNNSRYVRSNDGIFIDNKMKLLDGLVIFRNLKNNSSDFIFKKANHKLTIQEEELIESLIK